MRFPGLILWLVLWVPVPWPSAVEPAAAASFTLGERGREAAVRAGERSVAAETFDAEWTVSGDGGQSLAVLTPFRRLAQAARTAAFRGEPLRPRDVEALLKDTAGKIAFWAGLRGDRPDFARLYRPVLRVGAGEVKPSFVQNERTALRQDDGRYLARCYYVFPSEGVVPDGRVVLVVRDFEERTVASFTLDLSTMR